MEQIKPDYLHFKMIFWFIVGICTFGASLTIFLIVWLPPKDAVRIADTALIFWLSTAVAGGIGYLIGSSAQKAIQAKQQSQSGTTAEINATITNIPEDGKLKEEKTE